MRQFFLTLLASISLTSPAFAQGVGASAPSPIASLMPLVVIFIVFYFLLIRPQRKRMQDHEQMIKAVKKGDTILSAGGIIGKIVNIQDDSIVVVEIAPSVEVKIARSMISSVLDKNGKPVVASDKKDKSQNADKNGNTGKNDNVTSSSKSVANDN